MSLLMAFEVEQRESRWLVGSLCMGSGIRWERRCGSGWRVGGRVRAKRRQEDREMGANPMPEFLGTSPSSVYRQLGR